MKAVPQPIAERIGKLIPRLASQHEGEVIATVRAMERTLAGVGCDLHDAAERFAGKMSGEPVFEDTPEPTARTYRGPSYYEFNARDPWGRKLDACRDAVRVCRAARAHLSPWERSFLDSIASRLTHSLGLTTKQQTTLLNIAARVSA